MTTRMIPSTISPPKRRQKPARGPDASPYVARRRLPASVLPTPLRPPVDAIRERAEMTLPSSAAAAGAPARDAPPISRAPTLSARAAFACASASRKRSRVELLGAPATFARSPCSSRTRQFGARAPVEAAAALEEAAHRRQLLDAHRAHVPVGRGPAPARPAAGALRAPPRPWLADHQRAGGQVAEALVALGEQDRDQRPPGRRLAGCRSAAAGCGSRWRGSRPDRPPRAPPAGGSDACPAYARRRAVRTGRRTGTRPRTAAITSSAIPDAPAVEVREQRSRPARISSSCEEQVDDRPRCSARRHPRARCAARCPRGALIVMRSSSSTR